uniref:Uncharacterized protein n=1 Tax=Cyprinus carpio TaxID=7962 RepID=A0A8C2KNF4_CYPCA
MVRKPLGSGSSFRTQTLASFISKTPSTAERKEFIFDFIKTFIEADIPLEKKKRSAFLQKYYKQGGSVPALITFHNYFLSIWRISSRL